MEDLSIKLKKYGQEHLLKYADQCDAKEQSALLKDIESIDFESLSLDISTALSPNESNGDKTGIDSCLQQIPAGDRGSYDSSSPEELANYKNSGFKAIRDGKVGVILLAGGQGTRLGVSYPKGMYDIGLLSGKTLFQIQMERIKRLESLSGGNGRIVLYVMTSSHTLGCTRDFFIKNDYFGLSPEDVVFFEQKMIPCFDFEGKVILEDKCKISRAPNGNGGLYFALKEDKILEHMQKRGIEYIHTYCVDNILVKVADPAFIGYCINAGVEVGNKVVKKENPNEAVGVVCLVKGKYHVIEYSEISKETAELRDAGTGDLMYNAGNICNHFFTLQFLQRICASPNPQIEKLTQHIAKKKIPYYNGESTVKPSSNTGIKLERFVFDVFEFTDRLGVWDVQREIEISPLKNSDNAPSDNPTTAREAVYKLHRKYIQNAGGSFTNEGPVEISPLVTYEGEGLEEIVNGKTFTCPVELK